MLNVEEGFSVAVIAGYRGDISLLSPNQNKRLGGSRAAYANHKDLVESLIAQVQVKLCGERYTQGNHKDLPPADRARCK